MSRASRGLTQRNFARLPGASQITVTLVLNNRTDAAARITSEARERMIRETGYVVHPLVCRMHDQLNQIVGVFTYGPAFPGAEADFYYPLLRGTDEEVERSGCDLLLFTSATVTGSRRRIFHGNSRLRVADGCRLLGRDMPPVDLARLVAEGYPLVCVGRCDGAGGRPVPYAGAGYASATAGLVERAKALGHERFAHIGTGDQVEPSSRLAGCRRAAGPEEPCMPASRLSPRARLSRPRGHDVTAVVIGGTPRRRPTGRGRDNRGPGRAGRPLGHHLERPHRAAGYRFGLHRLRHPATGGGSAGVRPAGPVTRRHGLRRPEAAGARAVRGPFAGSRA